MPIRNGWHADGPDLPVEFLRQSSRNRLTLVICDGGALITCLWALMVPEELDHARLQLLNREGMGQGRFDQIAFVTSDTESTNPLILGIKNWLSNHNLDAAIWTDLPPRYGAERIAPTLDQAIEYLHSLINNGIASDAEEYIRRAPRQIRTTYRERFEQEFGWTYSNS